MHPPSIPPVCFPFRYSVCLKRNQGATPFVLDALLLLAAPEVLTLQKFVALLTFGETSHQLHAAMQDASYPYLSASDFIHAFSMASSFSAYPIHSSSPLIASISDASRNISRKFCISIIAVL